MARFGTNILATKFYIPIKKFKGPMVANEGRTEKEVEGRAHPVMTDRDHESTATFNRFENPHHLCIRGGPSEHDGPS